MRKTQQERRKKGEKSMEMPTAICCYHTMKWNVNHEVQRASCEVLQGDFGSMAHYMERGN